MQTYEASVLQLDDGDFLPDKEGDLYAVKGGAQVVNDHRIIIWRGVVLKNNLGPSASKGVVLDAQIEMIHDRKE